MSARAILSAALSTAFIAFIPLHEAPFPALYLLGLFGFATLVIIDAAAPGARGRTERISAWIFVASFLLASAGALIDRPSAPGQLLEPEENISSASLRI